SDIFSFGVLLYRMATGDFPFSGPTAVSTLAKILEARQESPRLKNENIPPELERIIDKCLRKDPNDRYQDTRDLVVDLRNLRRLYDSGASETISSELAAPVSAAGIGRLKLSWKSMTVMIVAILAVLVVVLEFLETDRQVQSTGLQAKTNSLAILGFENKTGDTELDWLETGLPQILLTDFAQAEAITIISRERIIDCFPDDKRASHTFDECADAAASLGAVNLLSGAYYKLGDKIRIDARLQDVATGNIIFGEKVVGDDPFTLVDSLTEKIAASLNIGYTEPDRNVALYTSSSPEAFKHYHLGVDKMYLGLYDAAIDEFNQALAIDSTFALAYMRIGQSFVFDGREQEGARYFQKALEYQHKLPERDQSLLEVHADLWLDEEFDNAFIKMTSFVSRYPDDKEAHALFALLVSVFTGDTVKAYAHLDTALRIDPTYALALEQYVNLNRKDKQYDRAIEYAQLMKKYHPESPEPALALARIYVVLNRLDDAVVEVNGLLDRFPGYQNGLYLLSNLYIARRDFESCLEVLERLKEVDPDDSRWMWSYYHQRSDVHGWRGQFRESIKEMKNALQVASRAGDSTRVYRTLSLLAENYHRIGEPDSAFYFLKKSYEASNALTMADYPLTAVAWDHKKAEELGPIMDSALAEFQKKIPSELWALVNNVRDLFYAYGSADTNKLIEVLESQKDLQRQVNSSEQGRTLGKLQILTGDYERGKANIKLSLGEFGTLVTSDQYVSSHYYLGLAEEGLGNTESAIGHYEEVLEYWGKADVQTDIIKDTKKRLAALTG
ncbi:MAG: tetratricopeptide repeat protein, partial [Candidatus Zixiibacteriota bacterium]